jgi:phosphoribosylaminoimidazole (AIR) synthetase
MGIGMVLAVPADVAEAVRFASSTDEYQSVILGKVVASDGAGKAVLA